MTVRHDFVNRLVADVHGDIRPTVISGSLKIRGHLNLDDDQVEDICFGIARVYLGAFKGGDQYDESSVTTEELDRYLGNENLTVRDLYRLVEEGGYPYSVDVGGGVELKRVSHVNNKLQRPTYLVYHKRLGDFGFAAYRGHRDGWCVAAFFGVSPSGDELLTGLDDVVDWVREQRGDEPW